MEEWYKQQEFFTQVRMDKIQSWMSQEFIDFSTVCPSTFGCVA
jgi:hypothetical protein